MDNFTTDILNCVKHFFYREALIFLLLVMLSLIALAASIYGFKYFLKKSVIKAILLVLLTCVCALTLTIIKIVEFIPVYSDYCKMDCVIEQNADVLIIEGTNNMWEQKNIVHVRTQDGEDLELKIVYDYRYETGVPLQGTIVYTKRSKHIVWYDF